MGKTKTQKLLSGLKDLKQELNTELIRVLDYWCNHSIDKKYGGFIGSINGEGVTDYTADKSAVLNTRILWTFSMAFRKTGVERYKEMADRASDYIKQYFIDAEFGGIYWAVNYKGEPANTRKQAYAQGFAIYGFSEYYLATGNTESLELAKDLFYLLEDKFKDPKDGGYIEALGHDWGSLEDMRLSEKDANFPKSMNTHLHIIEPYTNLYRAWKNEHLKTSIGELIKTFTDKIIDAKTGHCSLFFDMDWTVQSETVSYGHDIEGAWLLREAATEIGDRQCIELVNPAATKLVLATLNEGVDTNGGLFYESENNTIDTDRHWWPQAEAMVGFFDEYVLTGKEQFLEAAINSWNCIKNEILCSEGEWLGRVNQKGIPYPEEEIIGFWKCPYHNSRALIEVMQRIDKQGE